MALVLISRSVRRPKLGRVAAEHAPQAWSCVALQRASKADLETAVSVLIGLRAIVYCSRQADGGSRLGLLHRLCLKSTELQDHLSTIVNLLAAIGSGGSAGSLRLHGPSQAQDLALMLFGGRRVGELGKHRQA